MLKLRASASVLRGMAVVARASACALRANSCPRVRAFDGSERASPSARVSKRVISHVPQVSSMR
jgi:hypothetical protein